MSLWIREGASPGATEGVSMEQNGPAELVLRMSGNSRHTGLLLRMHVSFQITATPLLSVSRWQERTHCTALAPARTR